MDIIPAVATLLFVLLYFWTAYNIPVLTVGVRRMLRADSKKKEANEEEVEILPAVSIVTCVPHVRPLSSEISWYVVVPALEE